jgi:hypothetical protein
MRRQNRVGIFLRCQRCSSYRPVVIQPAARRHRLEGLARTGRTSELRRVQQNDPMECSVKSVRRVDRLKRAGGNLQPLPSGPDQADVRARCSYRRDTLSVTAPLKRFPLQLQRRVLIAVSLQRASPSLIQLPLGRWGRGFRELFHEILNLALSIRGEIADHLFQAFHGYRIRPGDFNRNARPQNPAKKRVQAIGSRKATA